MTKNMSSVRAVHTSLTLKATLVSGGLIPGSNPEKGLTKSKNRTVLIKTLELQEIKPIIKASMSDERNGQSATHTVAHDNSAGSDRAKRIVGRIYAIF